MEFLIPIGSEVGLGYDWLGPCQGTTFDEPLRLVWQCDCLHRRWRADEERGDGEDGSKEAEGEDREEREAEIMHLQD